MKREPKVKVIQKENEEPVETEIIAQSIKKISDSVERMYRSGLSDKAITLLLRDASGESLTSVRNVLFGLKNLRRLYLKA